jgi:hypothetical protein
MPRSKFAFGLTATNNFGMRGGRRKDRLFCLVFAVMQPEVVGDIDRSAGFSPLQCGTANGVKPFVSPPCFPR